MPYKGQAITAAYFAEDVSAGGGKTGDAANHALRRIVDGVANTIAASPAEIDAANLPGWYKIALTGAENSGDVMALGGKSSTANVVIRGTVWTNAHNLAAILGTPPTEGASGRLAASVSKFGDVASPVFTATCVNQGGDAFTRIGDQGGALTALPWNAGWDAEVESQCADALAAYDPPTNAEMEARTLLAASYATAANQATIIGYIDTEVAAILAAVDTEVAAIKAKTDKLPDDPAAVGSEMGLADGAITAAKIATGAIDADAVAADAANEIADAMLIRNVSQVEASAPEHSLCTIVLAMLESSIDGTTWTIKRTTGATHATKTVTKDPAAEPITGVS